MIISIEIKVGQRWRVVDGCSFSSCNYTTGDILTISSVDGVDGIVDDPKFTFITHLDIKKGLVELVEDESMFNSITQQIPPVGTKCLYSFDKYTWWECEVVSQYRPVIYCPHLHDPDENENGLQIVDENAGHYINTWYRPLPEEKSKSAAQARMEEIEAEMRDLADKLQELNDEH